MKNLSLLPVLLLFYCHTFSQGLWIKKAECPQSFNKNISFEINGKGYLYTGEATNNFFEYDPVANTWISKASFPGAARNGASGFAIDSLGYVGLGKPVSGPFIFNDFYKYSPATNSWITVANYPDSVYGAFSFNIASLGYIAGGNMDQPARTRRARSYNPVTDTWSLIDSLPSVLSDGFAEVVGNKAYCGLGFVTSSLRKDSILEYDPALNSWSLKAPYTLTSASYTHLHSFVTGNKIYVADPRAIAGGKNGTMGVFDPASNTWSSIDIYPYPTYTSCGYTNLFMGMTIAGKGYLGGRENCTLTTFWQYDPANSFVLNSFSPDSLCENDSVTVSFSSSLTFNPGNHFKLKFNGANYTANSGISDSIAGTTTGTYNFKVPYLLSTGYKSSTELVVYSTDPAGQTSYLSQKLLVKKAPREFPMDNVFNGCAGSALIIYRDADPGLTHSWSSDPAGFSGSSNTLSVTPTQNTTIYITDSYPLSGCSISDSTLVVYNTNPSLNISDSSFNICAGQNIALGGTPTTNAEYLWTGNGLNSTSPNPVVNPSANSTYNVLITDTNSGCSVSGNTTVSINQPRLQDICFVTVDDPSTHNIVVWEKVDKAGIDSFIIYREITTNNYQRIGAVHRDSLSEYHDYAANPNSTAYRYKIAARDTCLNIGNISPFHNTIHIQYLSAGNLNWNVYEIENDTNPVNSFDVFIDDSANGNWDLMLTVPGTQASATDINYSLHPAALYKVVANFSYSCSPTRSSNKVASNITSQSIGTGIAAVDLEKMLSIYPNPANNLITINAGRLNVETIGLLNVDGRVVLQNNALKSNTIDITALSAGFYIVNIKTNEGVVKKQVIKL